MDLRIEPGSRIVGAVRVPGDKSIAHRWIMAAATARGRSRLIDLPPALDVRSTARVMGTLAPQARPGLDLWASNAASPVEGGGSTWNAGTPDEDLPMVEVEGEGRAGLVEPHRALDCGNSGTTMRLVCGLLAPCAFPVTLDGDASLRGRPMERVAAPLRAMGVQVATTDGHAPVSLRGGRPTGREIVLERPSAQVKSAILLAGLAADGTTSVSEPAPTRDHTERLFRALGGPVEVVDGRIQVRRFDHRGFEGRVPGDPSAAVYLLVAAALTGGGITITGVGLNPSRLHVLEVLRRMGVPVAAEVDDEVLGEPMGSLRLEPNTAAPVGARIEPWEIPLIIDEVPALAALAVHASGESWFLDAGELRVKESDRLERMAGGLRELGGHAADEGDDLVIAGTGLAGGTVTAGDDHRIAMALVVAGLAASGPVTVREAQWADVSFPGFGPTLAGVGGRIEAS
jgi:3-phosphoshikimate 1-carboxyvinyltransferase